MDPLKGFDELIRATALLRERGVPAQLKLAGHSNAKTPDHASDLRKLIDDLDLGDSVTLLGAVPSLDELYEEARVVALASRRPRRSRGSSRRRGHPARPVGGNELRAPRCRSR